MAKKDIEQVDRESANAREEYMGKFSALFPEVFTEGKIDWDKLRAVLGDAVDERRERYSFTWAGKGDALRLLQVPSRATLIPTQGESVNFDTTQHLFIEGDNLEVLKLLYRPYFGRVKMIYIDPPYNTGGDFVYPDNYSDPLDTYLRITGQKDGNGNLLTTNPETSGRYHSAWLSMMYPRLFLARQLLRDDGVILVSIDDGEVANLKLLMNEIFGEENFVGHIVWQKRYVSNVTARFLSDMHDHILVYARQRDSVTINKLPRTEEQLQDYKNPDDDPRGPWRAQDLSASKPYSAGRFTITTPAGIKVNPPPGRYWRCNEAQYNEWLKDNRIWFGKSGKGRPMLKAFLSEVQDGLTPNTWWSYNFAGHNKEATLEIKELFDGVSPFDTAKPVKLIRRMLELFSERDSLVLDFFAGSCTTAHAVLEINHDDGGDRRFAMVQLPEPTPEGSPAQALGYKTIADIGKDRIRRAANRIDGRTQSSGDASAAAEDLGFKVFKLAPSNYKQWTDPGKDRKPDAEEYLKQMEIFADPLREGWDAEPVIYEVAMKEGYGLNCRIEPVKAVEGGNILHVDDPDTGQSFYVCLDAALNLETLKPLSLTPDDLFICRDVSLTDEAAANLALQCRLKTI